jgi:hypothetical protein
MAQVIARMAVAALGLSGASFHEPFHAGVRQWPTTVTERSDRNRPQRHRNLTIRSNRTLRLSDIRVHVRVHCAAESCLNESRRSAAGPACAGLGLGRPARRKPGRSHTPHRSKGLIYHAGRAARPSFWPAIVQFAASCQVHLGRIRYGSYLGHRAQPDTAEPISNPGGGRGLTYARGPAAAIAPIRSARRPWSQCSGKSDNGNRAPGTWLAGCPETEAALTNWLYRVNVPLTACF